MKWITALATLIAITPVAAHSQEAPYGGQESRAIKALSADETKQYLAGGGLGYALSAELNSCRYDELRGYSGTQQGQDGAASHGKRYH